MDRQDLFWNRDKLVKLRFGKRGGQPLTLEEYFSEYSQVENTVFGGHALSPLKYIYVHCNINTMHSIIYTFIC